MIGHVSLNCVCIDKYIPEKYPIRYMAYLLELATECSHHGCKKRAVVEVFSQDNHTAGKYCREHGKRKLAEKKLLESGHG